jgi:methyl-accepting chemotaxis protein
MKAIITTGKSLLNALAFANVNRIDELHAQLDQMNATVDSSANLAQHGMDLSASGHTAFAPSIGHIQGAL